MRKAAFRTPRYDSASLQLQFHRIPAIVRAHITAPEMGRHVVGGAHGAAREVLRQFATLMKLARRVSRHGAGHIEWIEMIRRIVTFVTGAALAISLSSAAYAGVKLTLSYITKWEVISYWKVVGYIGETPFVFVDFSTFCPALDVGGNFVLRTFSPSIQEGDTVIVNGKQCRAGSVELIRQN